jgi:hypothetical protein
MQDKMQSQRTEQLGHVKLDLLGHCGAMEISS